MSNIQTVPAHIAARIAARKAGTLATSSAMGAIATGGDGYSHPKISIRAGRYRLVEDGIETPVGINLDVVIVGANPKVSKIFYAKPYDGSADGVRPDCFSNDGLKPDESVQNPVANGCANCPHNVLGSKVTPSGAKSKLCGDQRHIAVVPAADPNKVYGLTVSVASMKNMREYFKELQNFGVDVTEVVTELGFDDKVSFPKVTFTKKGFAPEAATAKLDAIANSDEVKEVVRLIPPRGKGPALAAPAANISIAAPAAVDDAYEEEASANVQQQPSTSTKAEKPKVTPVKASSALESKLDSLFG
jgi:hypothetical protein